MKRGLVQSIVCLVAALVFGAAAFACGAEDTGGQHSPGGGDDPAKGSDGGSGDGGTVGPDGGPIGSDPSHGAPKKTEPKALPVSEGFYPRAILRSNGAIVASVVRFLPGPGHMGATFFESTDGGVSFIEIGTLDDAGNKSGLCCGTLFELPKKLGTLSAGTLLWAASQGADAAGPMSIPVWKSEDGGHTWTYLSTVVVAGVARSGGGLWEPEFSMLEDGTLVCHWSDETDSGHSQKLVEARSSDGVTWGSYSSTVALPTYAHRPGMANVRRPPGGPFVLSYEICGLDSDRCTAFFRTSNDGWNWGDPTWTGNRPTTQDGRHFRHSPTLAWSASPGANGRFFMVGQMTYSASGDVASDNGKIILANSEGANGAWYPIPAPVPVPEAYDDFCPNYSSTLLPLENGTVALEIASKYENDACRSFFARSPLIDTSDASEIKDAAAYRLVSLISGLCLDIADGATAAGANVQQWTCNSSDAQRWTVNRAADGTISLRAAVSDMCLTVAGNSTTAGANVEQDPCGGAGQSWTLRPVGIGYYELVKSGSTVCLDVAMGSSAVGANVAQWTCNDLAPQIWRFDPL